MRKLFAFAILPILGIICIMQVEHWCGSIDRGMGMVAALLGAVLFGAVYGLHLVNPGPRWLIAGRQQRGDVAGLTKLSRFRLHDWKIWWGPCVDDSQIRRDAIQALTQLGTPECLEPLVEALGDDDSFAPIFAAKGLAALGDLRAVPPLLQSLRKMPEHVVDALVDLDARDSAGQFLPLLTDTDAYMRRIAAWALGRLGSSEHVEHLTPLLADNIGRVRQNVIVAMGNIGDERAVVPLTKQLGTEEADLRKVTVRALGRLPGHSETFRALIQTGRSDADSEVRKESEEALHTLVVKPGAAEILSGLMDSTADDPDTTFRRIVVQWLGRTNQEAAVAPLIRALSDPDDGVRKAAATGLGRSTSSEVKESLLNALDDAAAPVRAAAIKTVQPWRDRQVAGLLIARLQDSSVEVRRAAADALFTLGDPCAVEPLATYIPEEAGARRTAAEKSLREIYRQSLARQQDFDEVHRELGRFDPSLGLDECVRDRLRQLYAVQIHAISDVNRLLIELTRFDKDQGLDRLVLERLLAIQDPLREPLTKAAVGALAAWLDRGGWAIESLADLIVDSGEPALLPVLIPWAEQSMDHRLVSTELTNGNPASYATSPVSRAPEISRKGIFAILDRNIAGVDSDSLIALTALQDVDDRHETWEMEQDESNRGYSAYRTSELKRVDFSSIRDRATAELQARRQVSG